MRTSRIIGLSAALGLLIALSVASFGGGAFGGGGGAGVVVDITNAGHMTVAGTAAHPTIATDNTVQISGASTTTGCAAHQALRNFAQDGTSNTCNAVVDSASNGTNTTCSVVAGALTCNVAMTATAPVLPQDVTGQGAGGALTYADPNLTSSIFTEDFCNTGVNGAITYSVAGGQNGGSVTVPGYPCIDDMNTQSSTTGRASWTDMAQALQWNTAAAGKMKWIYRVNVLQLSTAAQEFVALYGPMATVTTSQPNAGAYFLYDRGNSATGNNNTGNKDKWECVAINGTTNRTYYVMDGSVVSDASFTTVNAPITANTWTTLEIDYDATLGTPELDFYVDGVLSCKITTNIPTGTGSTHTTARVSGELLKTVGTTQVDVYVDRVAFYNYGISR